MKINLKSTIDCSVYILAVFFFALLTMIPAFSALFSFPHTKLGFDLHSLLVGFAAGMDHRVMFFSSRGKII